MNKFVFLYFNLPNNKMSFQNLILLSFLMFHFKLLLLHIFFLYISTTKTRYLNHLFHSRLFRIPNLNLEYLFITLISSFTSLNFHFSNKIMLKTFKFFIPFLLVLILLMSNFTYAIFLLSWPHVITSPFVFFFFTYFFYINGILNKIN